MQILLENEELRLTINSFGAEMTSIYHKKKETEYLWCADAAYWKRSAPVLFPFVGSLQDKTFRYEGKTYPMGQHGFARDMEFEVESQTADQVWFVLRSNEQTLEKYPLAFALHVGYHLAGRDIRVMWRVENPSEKELYFSIGGHPAFMCPLADEGRQTDYYLKFNTKKDITYKLITDGGVLGQDKDILPLTDGYAKVSEHLFDRDALIVEDEQASQVSLCMPDRTPYLTVSFDAPLFGLWTPVGKGAPFICIEPWYGRCDRAGFAGELKDREYGNCLGKGETFEASYQIHIA